jgi:hypothetical protein
VVPLMANAEASGSCRHRVNGTGRSGVTAY